MAAQLQFRDVTLGYDASGRRTSIGYSDPATPDVTYQYDANGNRTSMVDGTGTTTYSLDEANRPVSVTSPGSKTVGYRYDLDGNRTKLIYTDATAVTNVFNKAGQLSSLSDWAGRATSYTYWPDSVVKTATNPDASVTTYAYDNARRLMDILHRRPGALPLDRFFYTLDSVGNFLTVADGSLDPQFARPDGLVSSNGTWTGTFASINEATPNDATLLASPSGPTTSNFYEVSLTDVDVPGVLTGIAFRYRYAKSGNNSGKITNLAVELRQGTTVIASQSHSNIPGVDGSGWQQASLTLTAPQAALITNFADLRLRFNPSSSGGGQSRSAQVSWAETQLAGAGHTSSLVTYGYDRLYRLTSAADTTGSRSYTYDPAGNRLARVAGTSTAYTYDRADRITAAGATSITVDANGNLTAKGANTFDFDQANRLASATVAGSTETYSYDGDGRRFSRQVGTGPVTRYVFDGSGDLAITLDDGTRKYVYGLGLAYSVAGTAIEVYHSDRLGSVRALTDAAGVVTDTYRTDEWGTPTSATGSSTQPFKFTGEPRDATGLTYLRTRYYDHDLGRFLTRDMWPGMPVVPQSQNRFSYASNNPTTYADPSGRFIDTAVDIAFIVYDVASIIFGPEKEREANLLALAADVASAFIPFVTGGGLVVRAGREAVEHADEVIGPIKYATNAAGPACSFTPETLVATPDGPVPISSIELGDLVLAWDESTGEVVERRVVAVSSHPDDQIARLVIDSEIVLTTPDHPFYTLEHGWTEAGHLSLGDHVRTPLGRGNVESVFSAQFSGNLWNLTVEGAHSYFVGTGQWLVHNACPIWKPPAGSFAGRKAMDDAARHFGVDRRALGDYVEELKGGMGRRGDQNVTITPDGDIVMPETGESLGSVFDLLGG